MILHFAINESKLTQRKWEIKYPMQLINPKLRKGNGIKYYMLVTGIAINES